MEQRGVLLGGSAGPSRGDGRGGGSGEGASRGPAAGDPALHEVHPPDPAQTVPRAVPAHREHQLRSRHLQPCDGGGEDSSLE